MRWVDRVFSFGLAPGLMPAVLERLRGTPVRITSLVTGVEEELLVRKPAGAWSVKEHIGHLTDLENGLHDPRIDDFLAKATVLRAWDTTNAVTDQAGHNQWPIEELLERFGATRARFVERLAAVPDEVQRYQSLHPRLQVMMRPVDMTYFVAEHDDHHLFSIRELLDHP